MRKLDFLIAGVQKCGTTALHRYLAVHPGLFLSARKELHFFDNEQISWEPPDYSALHSHFVEAKEHQITGEATPIYVYWRPSLERIHAYNPNIKLIILLRDPIERAYSHWLLTVSKKKENMPFGRAIREGRGRFSEQHRGFSYVERGLYSGQIQRVLTLFPREHVLFLKMEDLRGQHALTLNKVCAFLGASAFDPIPPVLYVKRRPPHAPMDMIDRSYLADIFRNDIQEVRELTGLDLTQS
jgi:hypothetical protein